MAKSRGPAATKKLRSGRTWARARRRPKLDADADGVARRNEVAKARLYQALGISRRESRPPPADAPSMEAFFDLASEDLKAHLFLRGYFENGRTQFFSGEREAKGREALTRILSSARSDVPEVFRQPVPDLILRDLCAVFAQTQRRFVFKSVKQPKDYFFIASLVKKAWVGGQKWNDAVKNTAASLGMGTRQLKEAWAAAKREFPEVFGKTWMRRKEVAGLPDGYFRKVPPK
jgi:hypothetical protein